MDAKPGRGNQMSGAASLLEGTYLGLLLIQGSSIRQRQTDRWEKRPQLNGGDNS